MIYAADPTLTLAEARDIYFEVNGFGADGGYDDAWVDFKLGPIPMPFPNTPQRVRAVKFHDLHHILSAYGTDVVGEFEISAWELGGGCADMVAAWVLNLLGMFAGMFVSPRRMVRAFLRGRKSGNLYRTRFDDELLGRRVADARAAIGLSPEPSLRPSLGDVAALVACLAAGLVLGAFALVFFVPLAIFANVRAAVGRPVTAKA
jgi:hypothetical protein